MRRETCEFIFKDINKTSPFEWNGMEIGRLRLVYTSNWWSHWNWLIKWRWRWSLCRVETRRDETCNEYVWLSNNKIAHHHSCNSYTQCVLRTSPSSPVRIQTKTIDFYLFKFCFLTFVFIVWIHNIPIVLFSICHTKK